MSTFPTAVDGEGLMITKHAFFKKVTLDEEVSILLVCSCIPV
jgi:hypothetical protein